MNGSLTVVGETFFVYLDEDKQQEKCMKVRKFSTESFSHHQAIPNRPMKTEGFGRKFAYFYAFFLLFIFVQKNKHFETSIIHFPTSEGLSEVSERANE